jgi:hypothetical protein
MHLASETPCNGEYVLAGQLIGKSGRTGFETSDNPSHLHLELRDSAGTARPIDDIDNTSILTPNTVFSLPDAENKRLFQCNKYPLVLPCKCHYSPGTSVATGCTFSKKNVLNKCWAVQEFPYTLEILDDASNQEEAQVNDSQEVKKIEYPSGFPPAHADVVRFICPNILHNSADKTARLQAKLRLLIENQDQTVCVIPKSQHLRSLSYRSNSTKRRTTAEIINGTKNASTREWVVALLKTYQLTLAANNANKNLTITGTSEATSHAERFINRYVNGTASNDQFIEAAYAWFNNIDFNLPIPRQTNSR